MDGSHASRAYLHAEDPSEMQVVDPGKHTPILQEDLGFFLCSQRVDRKERSGQERRRGSLTRASEMEPMVVARAEARQNQTPLFVIFCKGAGA